MKVATYNVNGIKSRLPNLLEWLDRERPNVACLQELKAQDGDFPQAALLEAGYRCLWKGQRSWNGVAVLSRGAEPIVLRRELPGDASDQQSRYLEVAVQGIVVSALAPPPGGAFLRWSDALIGGGVALLAATVVPRGGSARIAASDAVPASWASRTRPSSMTRPPSVVTSRACCAARRLSADSSSKPMSSHEVTLVSSQKT